MSLSCLVVALLLILLKNTSHVNTLEQNISNHSKDSNYLHHKEGTTIYVVFFLLNMCSCFELQYTELLK